VEVEVAEDLHAVLEPPDDGPGLALGHAQEDDLVAELVLVVEVGRLDDASALNKSIEILVYLLLFTYFGVSVISFRLFRPELARGRNFHGAGEEMSDKFGFQKTMK